MSAMTSFVFSGFYDVPRYIYLDYKGIHLVLQSEFDEDIDEYPTDYSIYVVPEFDHSITPWSPEFLRLSKVWIGDIPIDKSDIRC